MKNGKSMKIIAILTALAMIIGIWPYGNCAKVLAASNLSGFNGGTGTAEDPYQIATLEEFELLRTGTGGDYADGVYCYSDTYFVLTSDIYYDGSSILSNSTAAFWQCKIDGNGHSVNNIVSYGNPLFARMDSLEITNIAFNNCKLTDTPLFAKRADNCTLSNITVTNGKIDITAKYSNDGRNFFGGIVNEANSTEFNNVKVNSDMTFTGNGYVGMICGWVVGTIRNCVTSGTITDIPVYDVNYGAHSLGALCGFNFGDIIDSTNNANIRVEAPNNDVNLRIAGISGGSNAKTNSDMTEESYVISGCINQGNIILDSKYSAYNLNQFTYVAGIIATIEKKGAIKNCENKGSITTSENLRTAGIVCESRGTIYNSKNSENITTINTRYTAGIVCLAMANITSCENTGSIKSSEKRFFEVSGAASGIANELSPEFNSVTIDKCKNAGKVTVVSGKWERFVAAGIVNTMSKIDNYICVIKNSCNCNMVIGCKANGIINSVGSNEHRDSKIKCSIENCLNSGTINADRKNGTATGIIGWAENIVIKNCFNYGNIKAKTAKNDKDKAQLVWISNPGTEVINCCIIKKPENVYPAIGYSQGGKAKNTKSVTKAKMKSWNSFKNIIKNAGVKK